MFRNLKGYTLIELTVVIILIGLMMTMALPRLRYPMMTDNLKGATRKMIGTIRTIRDNALREQSTYYLKFDLGSNRYWIDSPSMTQEERSVAREEASSLPAGVSIIDIWLKWDGKKVFGETEIRFNEKGYIRPSVIHIGAQDGRRFTLVVSPFLGRVEVLEDYVDFEDI